ncbi:EAL domain-containing protein [Secundilactobacillus paracollinoides]|uniref:EAL domain-containing protein n=1 Tax=Secundilactobacillus paracollinoides TaxID=240427 RepID=UPI00081BDD28|nr:EAL domain-containing protein [Secundilactobacillus paracollinoides]
MLWQLGVRLFIIFWVIVAFFAIWVARFYYATRKRTNDYFDDPDLKLQYFIQEQVNYRGKVIGYECLLRQQHHDGTWTLPKQLAGMPLQRVVVLLEETFRHLPVVHYSLSINLTYEQIMDPNFPLFVRWAISKIDPMDLVIEYHATQQLHSIRQKQFMRQITNAKEYGVRIAIDNADSELTSLHNIEWLLPAVDILKCSMRSFRKEDPNVWLDLNLQFWNNLAKDNHISLYLMGIEDAKDEALAEQLQIDFRQGYLFGKPVNEIETGIEATGHATDAHHNDQTLQVTVNDGGDATADPVNGRPC